MKIKIEFNDIALVYISISRDLFGILCNNAG